jgi:hypothetical protein
VVLGVAKEVTERDRPARQDWPATTVKNEDTERAIFDHHHHRPRGGTYARRRQFLHASHMKAITKSTAAGAAAGDDGAGGGGGTTVGRHRRNKINPFSPPTSLTLHGVQVHFPFRPYPCQETYMQTVMDALLKSENALLESPTGTGKVRLCRLGVC